MNDAASSRNSGAKPRELVLAGRLFDCSVQFADTRQLRISVGLFNI
jgi:hypothetical protein